MSYVAEQENQYSLTVREKPIRILAVEDDFISMSFLQAQIAALGHKILKATNGLEALQILDELGPEIDVVLMDREMPIMDGLNAVVQIKKNRNLKNIPVVMVTGADSTEEIQQGLDAGVFYYLTKPVNENMLRSVLSAAVREAQESRALSDEFGRHLISFGLIDTCKFKFRTITEAKSLSSFIAHCFPNPEAVLSGVRELLINAIGHGNLGIGYSQKLQFVKAGTWQMEIERLQKLPHNEEKYATVIVAKTAGGTFITIEDTGESFERAPYMMPDAEHSDDKSEQGNAQENMSCFDKLTYNERGNRVVAFVEKDKQSG